MTVFWTVLTGVFVFVVGQFLLKWFVEPAHELKRTIGRVAHALVYRADFIANPGVQEKEKILMVAAELRKLAADLRESLVAIPWFDALSCVFQMPGRQSILRASRALVGLSNGLFAGPSPESEINQPMVNVSKVKLLKHELRIPDEIDD